MLPRLAMMKAARGLHAGPSVIDHAGGKVEMVLVEAGLQARDFGTEPPRQTLFGVHRDSNLTLLDDGMNINRTDGVGADADMHLRVHLQSGGGTRRDRHGQRS